MDSMTSPAFDALQAYIQATSSLSQPLADAYDHAQEFGLPAPDASFGQLLSTLAAAASNRCGEKTQAIVISPAASVVGLYLLQGLADNGILSCIDPEAEHQAHAKTVFRAAGYKPGRVRFLPARPLDVIGRLATQAYQIIYADVDVMDAQPLLSAAWPLLSQGGTLIIAHSLLDGTIGDTTRVDRATQAARDLDAYVRTELEDALITRLPLDSGTTLITKL